MLTSKRLDFFFQLHTPSTGRLSQSGSGFGLKIHAADITEILPHHHMCHALRELQIELLPSTRILRQLQQILSRFFAWIMHSYSDAVACVRGALCWTRTKAGGTAVECIEERTEYHGKRCEEITFRVSHNQWSTFHWSGAGWERTVRE